MTSSADRTTATSKPPKVDLNCIICGHTGPHEILQGIQFSLRWRSNVAVCGNCSSGFVSPTPTHSDIASCYEGDYRSDYFNKHWKNYHRGFFLGSDILGLRDKGTFLDIGCSIGSMMEGVRDRTGWDVLGVELEAAAAEECRKRGLNVLTGLIYDFESSDAGVNYILANNVLEHDPTPRAFLAKAHTLLAPEGLLHLVVPNGPTDLNPTRVLLATGGRPTTCSEGHINFFSNQGLRQMVSDCGFAVVHHRSFHFKSALQKNFLIPGSHRRWKRRIGQVKGPPKNAYDPSRQSKEISASKPQGRFGHFANWLLRRAFMGPDWLPGADTEIILRRL